MRVFTIVLALLMYSGCAPSAPEPTIGSVVYDPPPEPAPADTAVDGGVKLPH